MASKIKRKSITDKTPRTAIKRKAARGRASVDGPSRFGSFFLPLFLSICLLICLGVLGYIGMQSVTASKFFDVKSVDVRGTDRAAKDDIARIASNLAEKTGVWNSDLAEMKARIEKQPFVKTASISRVLPSGLRVYVVERVPIAVVKLSGGSMLVDSDGNLLAPVNKPEDALPITLSGWDESKTEKAIKDNLERIKLYQKMLNEWREGGLISRVQSVNLADLREPKAVTEDSGKPVTIDVGKDNFAQHLKNGVSAIAGKGDMFDGVSLVGSNMILSSRKNNELDVASR
ncbi:MAG: FtsQ-type POTRA domain-containing protein [Acidobacteria bacterium]|nr:FtsQ-type POTRA domain-containing protein [Acidobacteriota bacterium]